MNQPVDHGSGEDLGVCVLGDALAFAARKDDTAEALEVGGAALVLLISSVRIV